MSGKWRNIPVSEDSPGIGEVLDPGKFWDDGESPDAPGIPRAPNIYERMPPRFRE